MSETIHRGISGTGLKPELLESLCECEAWSLQESSGMYS